MRKKKEKSQQNDDEYTNIIIKECEAKRTHKGKATKGKFPLKGRIHKRGFRRAS